MSTKFAVILCLFSANAFGAITHEETASNSGNVASSGTLTVTLAGAPTDGEAMIAVCHRDSGGATSITASTAEGGWTTPTAIALSTTTDRDRVVDVFYKSASSDDTTHDFTNNGDNTEEMQCTISVYSDTDSAVIDVTPVSGHATSGANADPDPPSITTVTDNAVVFAIGTLSGTIGSPSTRTCTLTSYTIRHGTTDPIDNAYICIGDRTITTAAAENPAAMTVANDNGTDDWYGGVLAIKPASAATAHYYYLRHDSQ